MKLKSVLVFLLTAAVDLGAATVTEYTVPSAAMDKEVHVNVILPDAYDEGGDFPVLYLYHGAGGNHQAWPFGMPECLREADRFRMIMVCPDAELSWYLDSPMRPEIKYETFCAEELVAWTDAHFRTVRDRLARGTCGLSMGGHGALWIAIRHRETFGTAIALSAGVDFRPFPGNWGLDDLLGDIGEHPENWDACVVVNAARDLKDGELAISIDCGSEDFFYQVNASLHSQLTEQGVKHDYAIRPGSHTGEYWNNAIVYAAAFAEKQFRLANPETGTEK